MKEQLLSSGLKNIFHKKMRDWRKIFSHIFFPIARSNFFLILATLSFSLGINLISTVLLVEKAEKIHYIFGFILISIYAIIAGLFLTTISGSISRLEIAADSKGIDKWVSEFKKELKNHAVELIISITGAFGFILLCVFCGIIIIVKY